MFEQFKNLLTKKLRSICDNVEIGEQELKIDYNGISIYMDLYLYQENIEIRLSLCEIAYGGRIYESEEIPYWIEEEFTVTSENDFENAIVEIVGVIEGSTTTKIQLGRLIRIVQSLQEEYEDYEINFIKEML